MRLRHALHQHLSGNLRTTITVAISHGYEARIADVADAATSRADAEPTSFFFAPAWLENHVE